MRYLLLSLVWMLGALAQGPGAEAANQFYEFPIGEKYSFRFDFPITQMGISEERLQKEFMAFQWLGRRLPEVRQIFFSFAKPCGRALIDGRVSELTVRVDFGGKKKWEVRYTNFPWPDSLEPGPAWYKFRANLMGLAFWLLSSDAAPDLTLSDLDWYRDSITVLVRQYRNDLELPALFVGRMRAGNRSVSDIFLDLFSADSELMESFPNRNEHRTEAWMLRRRQMDIPPRHHRKTDP